MRDNLPLSVGVNCLCFFSSLGYAADTPRPKSSAFAGRAAVDTRPASISRNTAAGPRTAAHASRKIVRGQNPFEEPAIEASKNVIPPPEPRTGPPVSDMDALKRLRDRSAKERWDQLHQEWLKNRKNKATGSEAASQPAAADTVPEAPAEENPFEPQSETPVNTRPETGANSVPAVPVGDGSNRSKVPSKPVNLQVQPKSPQQLPTEEELNKLLNADNGERLPPPIRSPRELPKITEISPNPEVRQDPAGTRPIPEQDPKTYVQLGESNQYSPRAFPEMTYSFEATNVWSNPLYFEDAPLERYGHTLPPVVQPIASIAKFSTQIAFLPYQMTIKPLNSKIYPLGWYSPGDYVPYRLYPIPWNAKAAAVQAATVLGISYATP